MLYDVSHLAFPNGNVLASFVAEDDASGQVGCSDAWWAQLVTQRSPSCQIAFLGLSDRLSSNASKLYSMTCSRAKDTRAMP